MSFAAFRILLFTEGQLTGVSTMTAPAQFSSQTVSPSADDARSTNASKDLEIMLFSKVGIELEALKMLILGRYD